ncbi:MAG: gamma-glutamyltransferase family protein [Puniceicoccaceae bacterium]
MTKVEQWGYVALILLVFAGAGPVPLSGVEIRPVEGSSGMVVAGHPEAAAIGLAVLESGGTAMDAAVAMSFALGVAEPYGSGIGGKCVILYHEAASEITLHVNGMDVDGQNLDIEALTKATSLERAQGGLGVGVPGQVAAMELAHSIWGKMDWQELLKPAADLAEKGFLVVPGMPVFFERRIERLRSGDEIRRLYLPDDAVPEAGARLANPDLARTIRLIAERGRAGFYEGAVAQAIVDAVQAGGGSLTMEDFSNYEARLSEPLSVDWQDYQLFSSPPPVKGGATVLMVMKMLEKHDWLQPGTFLRAGNINDWSHAFRLVYPSIEGALGDHPESLSKWKLLMERQNLQALLEAMEAPIEAPLVANRSWSYNDECTTHFVVADRHGNVASVTQSLSHHFGSGVVAPGAGVILNNSLKNFNFWEPDSLNSPGPQKQPTSTIAPLILLHEGRPSLAIGLPGGQRIPTTLVQVLLDQLAFGRTSGEAIASPRVHLSRSFSTEPDSHLIQLEQALPAEEQAALQEFGWEIEVPEDSEYFGGVAAIELGPDGWLTGWADFRRTNIAAGF